VAGVYSERNEEAPTGTNRSQYPGRERSEHAVSFFLSGAQRPFFQLVWRFELRKYVLLSNCLIISML
jgi:hypothetical protein